MKKLLCAAFAAVALSACDKPAAETPAPQIPPAEIAAPVADTAASASPDEAPAPSPAAAQPAAEQAPAADAAADKTTDDAIDNALGDHARYRDAIERFQKAVAAKDAAAVAALIQYPFDATIGGKKVAIKDAAAFAARYDEIVTPEIADVIVKQKYADLFVNYKGVMFGSGEAWMNGICKDDACKDFDVKVVAIQPGA